MNKTRLIGYSGIVFLIIAGVVPIASVNSIPITILPIWDNFKIGGNIWMWRNISAFSVTYYLSCIICFYLIIKNKKMGVLFASIIMIICLLIIYLTIWISYQESIQYKDLLFNFSYGALFPLAGFVMIAIDLRSKNK